MSNFVLGDTRSSFASAAPMLGQSEIGALSGLKGPALHTGTRASWGRYAACAGRIAFMYKLHVHYPAEASARETFGALTAAEALDRIGALSPPIRTASASPSMRGKRTYSQWIGRATGFPEAAQQTSYGAAVASP